jgi:YD repeat-containing protein
LGGAGGYDGGAHVDFSVTASFNAGLWDLVIDFGNGGGLQPWMTIKVASPVTFSVDQTLFIYNGSVQHPNVTASLSNATFTTSGTTSATEPGTYGMGAAGTGSFDGECSFWWTISKIPQTISFSNPGTSRIGTPFLLAATASSGLPVTYSVVSGGASLTGNQITPRQLGQVTVRASQSGDAHTAAAPDVDVTFNTISQDYTGYGVGAQSGNFSVDNKGGANYSLPLLTPPGRGGMEPKLTLSYNSGAGNGPLGMGFSLSTGFPQGITRGRSILARDGETRGVTFDNTKDKFYLDGKRLLCVSGTYGSPGSTYRTEVDSFLTITTTGSGGNIETFTATDKNGVQMVFGKYAGTADGYQSGVLDTGADTLAYTYALKRVTDTVGNYVEFAYANIGNSEYVLSTIKYTGNSSSSPSVSPRAQVTFSYNTGNVEGSSARRDASSSYVALRKFTQTQRLDQIVVSLLDTSTSTAIYDLGYGYAPNQGRTRLITLSARLRDQNTGALSTVPPTYFEWANSSTSFTTTAAESDAGQMLAHTGYRDLAMPEHFAFGDVNGDGKDDLVSFSAGGISVSLSNGSGFSTQGWNTSVSGLTQIWKLCDLNGDGRKDIVYGGIGSDKKLHLYCLVSTGSSFTPYGATEIYADDSDLRALENDGTVSSKLGFPDGVSPEEGNFTSRVTVADFTGDGLDDILIHRMDGKLKLLRNQGNGTFSVAVFDVGAYAVHSADIYTGWFPNIVWQGRNVSAVDITMIPCDLNGDGITDYVWGEKTNKTAQDPLRRVTESVTYYAVTSLPGGGFSDKTVIATHSWQADPVVPSSEWRYRANSFVLMPCDLNGDGLTDFLELLPDIDGGSVSGYPNCLQFNLYHTAHISEGSPGRPQFATRIQPMPSNGKVNAGGDQVFPWFDKIQGSFFATYFTGSAFTNLNTYQLPLVNLLGKIDEGVAMCDVNLDGRDDFVWYVTEGAHVGWWVMYSQENGYSDPVPAPLGWMPPHQVDQEGAQYDYQLVVSRMAFDLNGDGIKDYAFANHYVSESPGIAGYHISAGQRGDRLVSVADGLASTTSIAYKPITDDSVYTPTAATLTYPIRELRNATYVVSDVYKDSGADGLANPAHFSYQYSGNILDLSGRGTLGFHSFITLDTQTNIFKYQFLTQSFPMTGLTAREQTYRYWESGGNVNFRLISTHDNTVVFDEVAGGSGTVYPFISRAVESRYENSDTAHFTWNKTAIPATPVGADLRSSPELLFSAARPAGAHITITAESLFDNQTAVQTTIPGGYSASDRTTDWSQAGTNSIKGTIDNHAWDNLSFPNKITYGNLTQLTTSYDPGYTETVKTGYLSPNGPLTGRVDTVETTATGNGYTNSAPKKTYTYFGNTPLVETEKSDGGSALTTTTTYHRDTLGRVYQTDLSGVDLGRGAESFTVSQVTTFDERFDLPTVSKDTYDHTTTVVYHDILGKPTSVTDVNGVQISTAYDAFGRVISTTDLSKNLSTTTTFAWDSTQTVGSPGGFTGVATGAPIANVVGVSLTSVYKVTTTATVKPTVTAYYDRLGRVIRTIKDGFNGQQVVVDNAYNNLGQLVATTLPYLSGGTQYWTKTAYDALGRVVTVTAPNGTITTNSYKGRLTQVTVTATDRNPQINTTLVDPKGATVAVWNDNNQPSLSPISGSDAAYTASVSTASVAFTLDGFGRMRVTTLNGQSQTITADYDALGHQTELNDPDKGHWYYANSALGQVLQQIDANSNATASTFDHLGRPLSRTTTGNSSTETANFYYYDTGDNSGNHWVAKGEKGWIGAPQREECTATGSYPTVNLHYYDAKGRPSLELAQTDGKWFYTYMDYQEADGHDYSRVHQVRHYWKPAGSEVPTTQPYVWQDYGYTYNYDSKSYLLSLTDSQGRSWWDTPAYDYMDRVTSVRKGFDLTTVRTYRPNGYHYRLRPKPRLQLRRPRQSHLAQ